MSPHIINPGHALRLRATQDLQTCSGERRATGEEWLIRDVGSYLPGVFEEVWALSFPSSLFLSPSPPLFPHSLSSFLSLSLPLLFSLPFLPFFFSANTLMYIRKMEHLCAPQVVSMVKAVTLTPRLALHIRALDSYTDEFGRKRCPSLQALIILSFCHSI